MTYRTEIHHRSPAPRPSPVQLTPVDTRAYRIGQCEILSQIGLLLADHTCTLGALRREIEDHLASIVTPPADPTGTTGGCQLHHGQAAACRDCLAFLADRQTSPIEDPTRPEPCSSLDLAPWYAAVDALHAEIDRTQRLGLPPSEEQRTLEALLLRKPGEPAPCTE